MTQIWEGIRSTGACSGVSLRRTGRAVSSSSNDIPFSRPDASSSAHDLLCSARPSQAPGGGLGQDNTVDLGMFNCLLVSRLRSGAAPSCGRGPGRDEAQDEVLAEVLNGALATPARPRASRRPFVTRWFQQHRPGAGRADPIAAQAGRFGPYSRLLECPPRRPGGRSRGPGPGQPLQRAPLEPQRAQVG